MSVRVMSAPSRLLVAAFLSCCAGANVKAVEGVFLPLETDSSFRVRESSPQTLATSDHLTLSEPTARQRALASRLRQRLREGDGAAAVVNQLFLVQTNFVTPNCKPADVAICPEPCNSVLIVWGFDDVALHPGGVKIFINNIVQFGDAAIPSEFNAATISGFPPGDWEIRVESQDADATNQEGMITVLDSQPMGDATGLTCELVPNGDGTCELVANLSETAPSPSSYFVDVNGEFLGEAPGNSQSVLVDEGLAPGEHCVGFQSLLETTPNVFYEGCRVESCCECTIVPCVPISRLLVCQVAYGPNAEDNVVEAGWVNGEEPYTNGLVGYLDGEEAATLPNLDGTSPASVFVPNLELGEHTIGIQGDCGEVDGQSAIVEESVTILESTPHPDPVLGTPVCEFADGTLTATWTNNEEAPSDFIAVNIFTGTELIRVAIVPGDWNGISVDPALETDSIVLQFFAISDGACYGSELIQCEASTEGVGPFLRGDVTGTDGLNLTDGITIFNFLFLGGDEPGCRAAANTSGEGVVNLTSGVYILNFLFLGGNPPVSPAYPECEVSTDAGDLAVGCATPQACP